MYERIQSVLHTQHEYTKSKQTKAREQQPSRAAKQSLIKLPPGIQSLASNPVMFEVKARSLSNQIEFAERRLSFEQMLHLSTCDSREPAKSENDL